MSLLFSFHTDQAFRESRKTEQDARGAHGKSKCIYLGII